MKTLLDRRFSKYVNSHHVRRSSTLFGFGDFSGEHNEANFETFSFMFLEGEALRAWMNWQASFRQYSNLKRRRMSYKALNDARRRQTLSTFLHAAQKLEAILFNVALPKGTDSIFEPSQADQKEDAFKDWKPRIADKAAKVIAFGSYFTASQSKANQDILIFFDQDSVLANVSQHTKLTELFGNQILAHANHNLGHFRLGSAKSDDGSLVIEDALAVTDLAAGAFADILENMEFLAIDGKISAFFNPSRNLKWKAKKVGTWLIETWDSMKVVNLLILPKKSAGYHALILDEELRLLLDLTSTNDQTNT